MTLLVKDGQGSDRYMDVTGDGSASNPFQYKITSIDMLFACSLGKIENYSFVDKFGENPDIDSGTTPEDIWEYGGVYPFSTSADIVSVSSSNAGDTQQVKITGLDSNWQEVSQTITLSGQTRVALTTSLIRVYRMENEGTTNFAGVVYCYSGTANTGGVPSGGSVVKAMVNNGNNQTLMAIYTVPDGKVGFLYRGEVGVSRGGNQTSDVRCAYYSRRYGKVFKIKKRVNLQTTGNSIYQDVRSKPDIIPARTDIKLTVESSSNDNVGVFGTFDILLVDESEFSSEYLTAIGQP